MTNPFFEPSTLPFGMPPFASIQDADYRPAFDKGMADQLAEIRAITVHRDMPTFENTMIPLEKSGQLLERVATVFFNQTSADGNEFTSALEEELAPQLSAHADSIRLDAQLYWRIKTLFEQLDTPGPDDRYGDAESRYLVERYFAEYTIAGAALDDAQKQKLRELNQRLSTLNARFEKNLLADTNDLAVVIDDVVELDGLESGEISAAAEAARERGLEGKYLITLILPSGQPVLSALTDRAVRERVMTASMQRGSRGGGHEAWRTGLLGQGCRPAISRIVAHRHPARVARTADADGKETDGRQTAPSRG